MNKTLQRDTSTDIPRRIYKTTIERMDKHLEARPQKTKKSKKMIKGNFNKFLITLLDLYEEFQSAKVFYANTLYADLEEARGAAISQAAKAKQKIKPPVSVLIVGEDEEL